MTFQKYQYQLSLKNTQRLQISFYKAVESNMVCVNSHVAQENHLLSSMPNCNFQWLPCLFAFILIHVFYQTGLSFWLTWFSRRKGKKRGNSSNLILPMKHSSALGWNWWGEAKAPLALKIMDRSQKIVEESRKPEMGGNGLGDWEQAQR